MGKRNPQKTRPVICRFVSRIKRDEMIGNRRKMKDLPAYKNRVYINEDLTNLRYRLLSYAKELPMVERVSVKNEKLYCSLKDKEANNNSKRR